MNISYLRCGPVGVRFIESRFAGRHKCRPYKDLKREFLYYQVIPLQGPKKGIPILSSYHQPQPLEAFFPIPLSGTSDFEKISRTLVTNSLLNCQFFYENPKNQHQISLDCFRLFSGLRKRTSQYLTFTPRYPERPGVA